MPQGWWPSGTRPCARRGAARNFAGRTNMPAGSMTGKSGGGFSMQRLARLMRGAGLALVCCVAFAVTNAQALDYPNRPIKWIVPYTPAGTTDILARIVGQYLSEKLGQQVIIENRPGGGNNLGTEAVVRAPADGYTLLLVNPAHGINATLYPKLPFNFIRDIAPVAG